MTTNKIVMRPYTEKEKEVYSDAFRNDTFSSSNPIVAMTGSPLVSYPGEEKINFEHDGQSYVIFRNPSGASVWKRGKRYNDPYGFLPDDLSGEFAPDKLIEMVEKL